MRRHWATKIWLLGTLTTMLMWFGCEQKGDMSPTGTTRQVLAYIDTLTIDPHWSHRRRCDSGSAYLSEANEPAVGEDVRFSVTRGRFGLRSDTTVRSDSLGRARSVYTAPTDTGSVVVRAELLSMAEIRLANVMVSSESVGEGLLSVWTEFDTLFADNGVSATRVYARLRNEAHNPIGGANISLSTNLGTVTSPVVTDEITGTAVAILVSTTETGEATVVARHGAASDTARVAFISPAAASRIVLSASRLQLAAGIDSAVITARVYDLNDLPVVDNTVVFFTTSQGSLTAVTGHTIDGSASTILVASASTGVAHVSATTGGSVAGGVDVEVMSGPAGLITVSAASSELFADNTSETEITAAVTDNFGNAVAQGTPVSFVATGVRSVNPARLARTVSPAQCFAPVWTPVRPPLQPR